MNNRILLLFLFAQALYTTSVSSAAPWGLPKELSDQNMKLVFEVHAPWNIVDGIAEQISGKISLADHKEPGSFLADISVQKIDYKAGLSVAGRLVGRWLRENPPTPAKFVIRKSSLSCTPETLTAESPCGGSVEGELTIWGKGYTIDVPIEMKHDQNGYLLEGIKEIRWGEYGFGDPSSTISNLKPVIDLNFSIKLSSII